MPDALALLGLTPEDIDVVILSHLHNDHTINLELFEHATIVMQRAEYNFWFGPLGDRAQFATTIEPSYLANIHAAHAAGRVLCVDGTHELTFAVTLIQAPGHTPGSQLVNVQTDTHALLLTGDVLHYFEELDEDRPFIICTDVPAMYQSFDLIRQHERRGAFIVPGHDARIAEEYETFWTGEGAATIVNLTRPLTAHRSTFRVETSGATKP